MRSTKFFIFFFLLSFSLAAQPHDPVPDGKHSAAPKSYFRWLIKSDSTAQAALINIRYQYLFTNPDFSFRRGGTSFVIGLNISRFVSKKMILGLSIDSRIFFAGLTRQRFTSAFRDDFNSNFIGQQANEKDSLRSEVLYNGINKAPSYHVNGSYPFFWGISFSPFPKKYGCILLEYKRGGSSFIFYGDYPSEKSDPYGEKGEFIFNTKNCFSVEISSKPFQQKLNGEDNSNSLLKYFIISVYYERFTLKGATFNNRPLKTYVSPAFIDKYSNLNYFGIKVGAGIY